MDKKTLTIAVLAVLAILGSVARLVITRSDGSSQANPQPYEQLGMSAADETVKMLKMQGSVVVFTETIGGMKNPNNEAQIKGLKRGLARSKDVTLKQVKELSRDMSGDPRIWPAEWAAEIASMSAGTSAVVLFVNLPPSLSPQEIAMLKGSQAKLLVVGAQSPLLDSLIAAGVVHVAIVANSQSKPPPSDKESPAQWFGRVYKVLHAK